MLKIGDFSKLSQVSVKTLRYYDQGFDPDNMDNSLLHIYIPVRIL
ncbi:MAG: MerR family DNA-binding transcriptional regulator [Anaerolineaceae bacterium]|nr:MerR family DNA-binding transcriptional regulator [Anaerolineaceae bacterium]